MKIGSSILVTIAITIWGLSMIGAACIWGWQLYYYAQTGQWAPFGFADFIYRLSDLAWWGHPDKWIGIHRILSSINAGIGLVISGAGLGLMIASRVDEKT